MIDPACSNGSEHEGSIRLATLLGIAARLNYRPRKTSMNIRNRRSGSALVLAGLAGVAFFWLTDHRYGLASRVARTASSVDEANQAFPGTVIGIAGSLVVVFIGMWLLTRRSN